jgi:hypothetical protein
MNNSKIPTITSIEGMLKTLLFYYTGLLPFISIDDAKLNKYTKKYQAMYKRDGKGISKRNITKITTL